MFTRLRCNSLSLFILSSFLPLTWSCELGPASETASEAGVGDGGLEPGELLSDSSLDLSGDSSLSGTMAGSASVHCCSSEDIV